MSSYIIYVYHVISHLAVAPVFDAILETLRKMVMVKVKVKEGHTPKEHRQDASSPLHRLLSP